MSEQLPKEQRVDALAKHIVSHIFDIGVEHGRRPDRMAYKVRLSGAEHDAGGLNEAAMRKYVADAIRAYELELNPPVRREDIT